MGARATDPQTSHAAAAFVAPHLPKIYDRICHALTVVGPMTTHEIAAYTGLSLVTVSPSIKPLRKQFRVVDTGARRQGRSVWAAVVVKNSKFKR